MKKIVLILFTICLMLNGCTKQKSQDDNTDETLNYVEYTSIDEMNEVAGTNITNANIAGKSNELYGIISDNIAQYKFDVNGEKWCIRASKDTNHDISGLNNDSIDFEKDTTATYYNDEIYMHRFFKDNVQYVITLDVKDKEYSRLDFDDICADFQTNITGVKSGYDTKVVEDGDDVIYTVTIYNEDASTTTMETIYSFKDDKMVSIVGKTIFTTEAEAKDYYDLLIENGSSSDNTKLDGTIITTNSDSNIEFYEDLSKKAFIEQLNESLKQ